MRLSGVQWFNLLPHPFAFIEIQVCEHSAAVAMSKSVIMADFDGCIDIWRR